MEMIHAFAPSEGMSAAIALRPSLMKVVQTEILPRLLLADRPPSVATTQNESAESKRLANLAFAPDRDGVADYLTFLQRRGASSEGLLLELIAPAARHLGALWEKDLCDFIEVTEGLGRLRAAAQDLLAEPDDRLGRDGAGPRALLTLAPGETHRLDAEIAAGPFRFSGFFAEMADDSEAKIAEAHFALLGFLISCGRHLDALQSAITRARAASLTRDLLIWVGGPLPARLPELVQKIGADAGVSDASAAVHLARELLEIGART